MGDRPFIEARIMTALRAHPEGRSTAQLVEAVYPDPDDMPDYADSCVQVTIFKMKRRGVPVEGRPWHGYRLKEAG